MGEYAGTQFGGIDLYQPRSVIVPTTDAGEVLEAVQIRNDVERLTEVMARGRGGPGGHVGGEVRVVLGRRRSRTRRRERAPALPARGEGLLLPTREERRPQRGRPGGPPAHGPPARGMDTPHRPQGTCASSCATGPRSSRCARTARRRSTPYSPRTGSRCQWAACSASTARGCSTISTCRWPTRQGSPLTGCCWRRFSSRSTSARRGSRAVTGSEVVARSGRRPPSEHSGRSTISPVHGAWTSNPGCRSRCPDAHRAVGRSSVSVSLADLSSCAPIRRRGASRPSTVPPSEVRSTET